MSDNSNPTESRSILGRYKFVWLLLLPLLVLFAVAAYWGAQEWNIARANQSQFEQWEAAGIPYDSASHQKFYNERTHPEGTAAWLKITDLTNWGHQAESFKQLPYLGYEGKEPANLVPGGETTDWPEGPLVASYLKEMEPLIDLIQQASSHPTPVRFPVKFQGSGTLLPHVQNARSVARLLMLDCDYAYFNQDNERALRDLSLMAATVEAYDGREFLVSGLVNVALRGMRMAAIRRTLTHCEWSAVELKTLRDSLASQEDVSARWQDTMFGERAFGLSIASGPYEEIAQLLGQGTRFKFFTAPSEVKTLMEYYRQSIELPIGADVSVWKKRAGELDDWAETMPANSLTAMIAPASHQCLQAEVRSEDTRRWTLTAVAIQQFKQENGQWPKELVDLESVGLKSDDYSDVEKDVFGYEVKGDKVFLWKRDPNQSWNTAAQRRISKTRPVSTKDKDVSDFVLELN